MADRSSSDSKLYYFVDIDTYSRQIIAWGIETRDRVELHLKNGCHRLFVSKGQYNKLVANLEDARAHG